MRIFQWMAIAAMTLFFPIGALAVNLGGTELGTAGDHAGIEISGTNATLGGLVGSVISVALNILGVILFVLFIYAGFLWMTAQGDGKKVQKAKDIMSNAIVGLVLTLLALGITIFLAGISSDSGNLGSSTTTFQSAVMGAGFTAADADLLSTIGTLLSVVLNILGVILFLIFIYAGFLWMTAAGDGKQVQKAKDMMRNAAIGLVIILLSRVMATFVVDRLVAAEVACLPQAIHSAIVT